MIDENIIQFNGKHRADTNRFDTWFDRYELQSPEGRAKVSVSFSDMVENDSYTISTRQVPNVLSVAHAPTSSSRKETHESALQKDSHQTISKESIKESYTYESEKVVRDYNHEGKFRERKPGGRGLEFVSHISSRYVDNTTGEHVKEFQYEDCFKVLALRSFFSKEDRSVLSKGREIRNSPDIFVESGESFTIEEQLPGYMFGLSGKTKNGRERFNKFRFKDLFEPDKIWYFIKNHTYWGKRLTNRYAFLKQARAHRPFRFRHISNMIARAKQISNPWRRISILILWAKRKRSAKRQETSEEQEYKSLFSLWNRLHRFFQPDESGPNIQDKAWRGEPMTDTLSRRLARFVELLKTVSGINIQLSLALPEMKWTWEKFDDFTLQNISYLLTDEFIHGNFKSEVLEYQSYYSQLKKMRKTIKDLSFNVISDDFSFFTAKEEKAFKKEYGFDKETQTFLNVPFGHRITISEGIISFQDSEAVENGFSPTKTGCQEYLGNKFPKWLHWVIPVIKHVAKFSVEDRLVAFGILCQTRGVGTPPFIDSVKSRKKFLLTVQEPPRERSLDKVRGIVNGYIDGLPSYIFTGLTTKAGISLTKSACLEATVEEGGTIHAIMKELESIYGDRPMPIIDLHTSDVTYVEKCELNTGERIFWHCLARVLSTDLEELRTIKLVAIAEPGKTRIVTKTLSYLKVVLDVVNKICSYPLKKVDSSKSGMSKESHGWEFFQRLFGNDINCFEEEWRSRNKDQTAETVRMGSLWVSSTDYETATDYLRLDIAEIISNKWMLKCGIPPVLRGIVNAICYRPRKVIYRAHSSYDEIGTIAEEGNSSFLWTRRGVMMGDPLTKPCLQLLNACTRWAAERYEHIE